MEKNINKILYGAILAVVGFFIWTVYVDNRSVADQSAKDNLQVSEVQETKPAEKIQVFLFHATQRCITCINIGKYAQKTVEQKFPEELKSGKIEFREINIDLPENKELAIKFKAAGSALFINPIVNGKDNIKEDTQVWRLASNEQAFINYLSDKIKKLL